MANNFTPDLFFSEEEARNITVEGKHFKQEEGKHFKQEEGRHFKQEADTLQSNLLASGIDAETYFLSQCLNNEIHVTISDNTSIRGILVATSDTSLLIRTTNFSKMLSLVYKKSITTIQLTP